MTEAAAEETKVEEQPKGEVPPGEQPGEKTDDPKKEPRAYTQDEVDKILAKVRKNERYRTRKEVEAFYAGRDSAAPKDEPKKEVRQEDKEPVRADFETYEDFLAARTDYRAAKVAREERVKADEERKTSEVQESRKKTEVEFQKKMREKFTNIDELVEEVGDMPMYVGVQDAIMESALGPEIFHELLQNPKEFERLAGLSQAAAIREIGKLEARLEAKAPKAEDKKEPTKPASKAPAPVSPPGGAAAATSDSPQDSDSTEEWMKKERARLAKLRQQR